MPRNTPLTVGEPIPSFELFDQDGQLFSSETFKGKPLVIFLAISLIKPKTLETPVQAETLVRAL